ncbi:MAG: head GIN domain-containing protein [Chitinophagaceae bacterium]|nr:head GIN domain-containing protein [Chitinophagaceae bacterium]
MKSIIALLLMGFITANATAQQKVVVNDANAQQRTVSGFTEISVSGGIDLYLSPDNKETVVVSASEERYRDRIVTRVVNNRLEIYFDNKRLSWKWPSNMKLKAYVSFKTLNKLKASGASDVYVNGIIKAESLQIEVSGASDFNGAVDVSELAIDQSGSSDARVSGRAEKLTVEVSGASDMKGYDLQVNYCEAHASGSSDIQITVNKELSARASGSSDIYYRGSGLIREIKTSGSSSVSKKG